MNSPIATCHVSQCKFNQNLDCQAPSGIQVNMHMDHADCDTFEDGTSTSML